MIRAHEISRQNQSDMVSHKINLGGFHNSLARPKDALKAVSHIADKDASTYGQMSAEEVRACAYAQMGDSAKLKASLDKMMAPENAKIGYRPLETALLCAKESDRLAQFIIARLDDPKTRNSALMGLQTYLPTPGATAQDKVLATRQAAVIARDDIQAAVKKYGRIISIPTQPPNY